MDQIVTFTLEMWNVTVRKCKLKGEVHALRWLACDSNFKAGLYDPMFNEWAQRRCLSNVCGLREWYNGTYYYLYLLRPGESESESEWFFIRQLENPLFLKDF